MWPLLESPDVPGATPAKGPENMGLLSLTPPSCLYLEAAEKRRVDLMRNYEGVL